MGLGGRAALFLPVIALAIALVTALFSIAAASEDAVLEGWGLAVITFVFAFIVALPVGVVLAFPAVMFGHLLPEPRAAWLIAIGIFVCVAPIPFTARDNGEAIDGAIFFGFLGAFAAVLWWHFVERHRELETTND